MSDDLLESDVAPEQTPEGEAASEDGDTAAVDGNSRDDGIRPEEHFGLTPPG